MLASIKPSYAMAHANVQMEMTREGFVASTIATYKMAAALTCVTDLQPVFLNV
jgi:hypothetical protein